MSGKVQVITQTKSNEWLKPITVKPDPQGIVKYKRGKDEHTATIRSDGAVRGWKKKTMFLHREGEPEMYPLVGEGKFAPVLTDKTVDEIAYNNYVSNALVALKALKQAQLNQMVVIVGFIVIGLLNIYAAVKMGDVLDYLQLVHPPPTPPTGGQP